MAGVFRDVLSIVLHHSQIRDVGVAPYRHCNQVLTFLGTSYVMLTCRSSTARPGGPTRAMDSNINPPPRQFCIMATRSALMLSFQKKNNLAVHKSMRRRDQIHCVPSNIRHGRLWTFPRDI